MAFDVATGKLARSMDVDILQHASFHIPDDINENYRRK